MHAREPLLVLLSAVALALGACGGGSDEPREATSTPESDQQRAAPSVPGGSLAIPRDVPLKASTKADPAAIKVIRMWTDALRMSDVRTASALWAVPSKVQNGTPVLTLGSLADVRLFNDSLSCGSRLVAAQGAKNGFTIATFELTTRPGADCGTGTGNDARTAILVRDGKIAEWYRLPDDPDAPRAPQPRPAAPEEPDAPII